MLTAATLAAAAPAAGQPAEDYVAEARKLLDAGAKCPPAGSGDEEIVVCGRRGEAEKYRLPIREDGGFDIKGEVESVSRERNALLQEGDGGVGSCTTVGPGGWTGCGAVAFKRRLQQEGK